MSRKPKPRSLDAIAQELIAYIQLHNPELNSPSPEIPLRMPLLRWNEKQQVIQLEIRLQVTG